MESLYRALNWKLQAGSHDFPGPDGGTCINEAAIVAAGMQYRAIGSADDCPPCFSRTIAAYCIKLNDRMPDAIRNELLMPFVTRLSGTADTPEVEFQRATFMAIATVQRILPIMLRVRGREDLAQMCASMTTLQEAREIAQKVRAAAADAAAAYAAAYADAAAAYAAAYAYAAAAYAAAYADAADAAAYADAADAAYAAAYAAADAAAYAAAADAAADAAAVPIWREAVAILDEAIKLGRHGNDLTYEVAAERMQKAKETAKA
jgi:hypothetical protein